MDCKQKETQEKLKGKHIWLLMTSNIYAVTQYWQAVDQVINKENSWETGLIKISGVRFCGSAESSYLFNLDSAVGFLMTTIFVLGKIASPCLKNSHGECSHSNIIYAQVIFYLNGSVDRCICLSLSIYIYKHIPICIYIYICVCVCVCERERERERDFFYLYLVTEVYFYIYMYK